MTGEFVSNADRRRELAENPSLSTLYTKQGRLTTYALNCGHQEMRVAGESWVRLHAERDTFVVSGMTTNGVTFRETFPRVEEARSHFDKVEL